MRFTQFVFLAVVIIAALVLYLYSKSYFNLLTIWKSHSSETIDWGKLEPITRKDDINHDKWIVATTINPPSEDIKKLAKIDGWKVVLVGDLKSPKEWSWPNCIYLDVKKQLQLGYETAKLLQFNVYGRKNIGYLYAIQHGAKVIYETDDDNSPTTGNIGFDPDSSLSYLVYAVNSQNVVNPYSHFGQSSIWPRGYPLDKIADKQIHQYKKCKQQRSLVQQGVVNGDPDVDAIFRLTRKDSGISLNVNFDSKAEPVLLPRGVMAPYNSQNTLYLYDAFWGLVLPQTVTFRVTDIWRGYWAQRLLWEINGNLAFFPPNAVQVRNPHNYLKDFFEEEKLYHQSSSIIDFLTDWKSSKSDFFDKILELSKEMAAQDYWGYGDVELIQAWLKDLIRIGYKRPTINPTNTVCQSPIETITPNEQPSSYIGSNGKLQKFVK